MPAFAVTISTPSSNASTIDTVDALDKSRTAVTTTGRGSSPDCTHRATAASAARSASDSRRAVSAALRAVTSWAMQSVQFSPAGPGVGVMLNHAQRRSPSGRTNRTSIRSTPSGLSF